MSGTLVYKEGSDAVGLSLKTEIRRVSAVPAARLVGGGRPAQAAPASIPPCLASFNKSVAGDLTASERLQNSQLAGGRPRDQWRESGTEDA